MGGDPRSVGPVCSTAPVRPARHLPAGRPHPECGSRTPRENSLILVITGVEPGDRGRPRRSGPESTCGPAVRGDRAAVVDTWTTGPSSTVPRRRPRPVPLPPTVRPQAIPRRAGATWTAAGAEVPRGGRSRWSTGFSTPVDSRGGRAGRSHPLGCTRTGVVPNSPTCAHPWGQLIDVSTEVTAPRPPMTASQAVDDRTAPSPSLWRTGAACGREWTVETRWPGADAVPGHRVRPG